MNINFGLHSQRRKEDFKLMRYQSHIRCNIAYTPWPSAYCPPHVPLVTSAILHLLSALLSHFQPTRTRANLVLFKDCGSILLAVGWLDYIVITSYVSQLVNHLRTRTPMGDLAGKVWLEHTTHRLTADCSNQLSYIPISYTLIIPQFFIFVKCFLLFFLVKRIYD